MAKESFDKEIQFLRMLALTSGAYNRQQFAERLGISVHTFDKTIRKLKDIVGTVTKQLPQEMSRQFAETLRFSYYESADPLLLFLYRAKSLKESESMRLSLVLTALQDRPLTAMALLDELCAALPPELAPPDEKTLRADLKYMEEVGVIRKESGGRPYRYRLHNDWIEGLSAEELTDLYDFVDIMANMQVPSVQGYLLRDSLKRALKQRGAEDVTAEPFLYKYHYYSRILDEAHLYTLLAAIRARREVRFVYFSPKQGASYASRNTNPLFERDAAGKPEKVLPLQVVYDHQYGRWYLLGHNGRRGIGKYRMEGLTQIEEGEPVAEALFMQKMALLEADTRYSWLIDTGRTVTVRARFFNPPHQANFVRERVLQQGQWGRIVEEERQSFIYEITVNGQMEIKPWLRSFGSSCEVLEPASLRRELMEEWKELQAYYESVRENF